MAKYQTSFAKSKEEKRSPKYGPISSSSGYQTSFAKSKAATQKSSSKLDITELARQMNVEAPKKKTGILSRISGALSTTETGDLAYRAFTGGDLKESLKYAVKGATFQGAEGKKTWSDVLKDVVGIKGEDIGSKAVRFIGGTALDIVTDPSTYMTLGLSAVPKLIGKEGAEQVAKIGAKELAEQVGKKGVKEIAEQAGKRSLKIAGKEVAQLSGIPMRAAQAYLEPLGLIGDTVKGLEKAVPAFGKVSQGFKSGIVEAFGGKFGLAKKYLDDVSRTDLLPQIKNLPYAKQEAIATSLKNNIARWEKVTKTAPTIEQLQKFTEVSVKGFGEKFDKHVATAVETGMMSDVLEKQVNKTFANSPELGNLYKDYVTNYRNVINELSDEVGYSGEKMINYMTTTKLNDDVTKLWKSNFGPDIFKTREGKLIEQTIKEAKPFQRMVLMESQLRVAKAQKDNLGKLIDNMGDMAKKIEDATPAGRLKKGFEVDEGNKVVRLFRNGQVEAYQVPEEIAKTLGTIYNPNETPKMLKWLDDAQKLWKSSVTSWFPSFHVRNATNNSVMLYLAGVKDPTLLGVATKVQKGGDELFEFGGKSLSFGDIKNEMINRGLVNSGQFGLDMSTDALKNLGLSGAEIEKLSQNIIRPDDTLWKKVWNKVNPKEVGNYIENNAKATLFLDRLKKGDSFDDAAEWVRNYLFDYSDLSQFESTVMKRIFPFYTFFKKNLEAQIKILGGTMPGRSEYSNIFKTIRNIPDLFGEKPTPEEESLLPDWVRESLYIPLGKDKDGNLKYLSSLGLGIEDLANLTPDGLMSKLSPLIKVPIELSTGYSYFTGEQIADEGSYYRRSYPAVANFPGIKQFLGTETKEVPTYGPGGQQVGTKDVTEVDPTRQYLLQSVLGRGTTTIGKALDVRKTPYERALNTLTGAKVSSIDIASEQSRQQKEIEKKLAEILVDMGYLKEFKTYYKPKK